MSVTTVYLYDLTTGAYVDERPSYAEAERKYGLHKNAVYDALRRGKGILAKANLVASRTKYDVFPIDTLPNLQRINRIIEVKEPVADVKTPSTLLTEEQVRQRHDMFFMIISFVNRIPNGNFVEEGQLLRELGLLGKPRYREALSRPELREHKGKVDGTTYYGSTESIRKLKQEGVLQ
jgi:hypothetical protein